MKRRSLISWLLFVIVEISWGSAGDVRRSRVKRNLCIDSEKCYKELDGRCFPCAFSHQPNDLENINMRFYLYTPERGSTPQEWGWASTQKGVREAKFATDRDIWVIIHGWEGQWPLQWLDMMRKELIAKKNNVVVARWSEGTHYGTNYLFASANGLVVGALTANVIKEMAKAHGLSMDRVNIIGFSLGAPIAGHTGMELEGKAKQVVGLDPPSQFYDDKPPNERLDPTDARLVQVIHTHGDPLRKGGLGTLKPMGDVDIYVNGGKRQPGCPVTERDDININNFYDLIKIAGCNHLRSPAIFTDSIRNSQCQYWAFPCSNKDSWDRGYCYQNCEKESGCAKLGYQIDKNANLSGKFYLATEIDQGVNKPNLAYCAKQWWVRIVPDQKAKGEIELTFRQGSRKKQKYPVVFQQCTVTKCQSSYPDRGRSKVIATNFEPDAVSIMYDRMNRLVTRGANEWNLLLLQVLGPDGMGAAFNGSEEIVNDVEEVIKLKEGHSFDYKAAIAEAITSGTKEITPRNSFMALVLCLISMFWCR